MEGEDHTGQQTKVIFHASDELTEPIFSPLETLVLHFAVLRVHLGEELANS
jgi:hypothetical protein